MKTNNNILLLACLLVFSFYSCKKEDAKPAAADVFYAVTIDGFTVTFENKTTGAVSYNWDFGDGQTSSEESPVHIYTSKGKFVPTLFATNSAGVTSEASTVIYISKASPIKLDDNSLADWDTIIHNEVIGGPDAGNFIRSKYDYDGENVYFYIEQNRTLADGNIYDFYIDADNDPSTGLLTGEIPGGAYEVLLEGTVFDEWLDVYYHSGDQGNFGGYEYISLSEFYQVGTVEEDNGVLKFEGAFKRNKLKGFTGKGLRIGIQVAANDWSAIIGYSPDHFKDAFFLDMSE